jgi:CspA family cold shock protein
MPDGIVKWYNEIKGYGFITTEEGKDIFVHRSSISESYPRLETGQKVTFNTKAGEKGEVAVDVKILKDSK